MSTDETIYDELGVPTVVNAAGTKTRISGTLMREEAADAMRRGANAFARVSDLQARASDLITEVTGAEAGYVTSGASAGLTLAAAACIAGDDLHVMERLPEGGPYEILVPRSHRNGYDHALRTAGAELVDVGNNDYSLGVAASNLEAWEIAGAVTEQTVAVAYLAAAETPPLEAVVEVAHDHDLPVIVDAAAELPPTRNLSRFLDQGADLVAFSGGKAVRGPQTTGILAGRRDLVRSAALQHLDMHAVEAVWDPPTDLIDSDALPGVPRHGIGRSMKVGKEEIVGLIRALEAFVAEDDEAVLREWHERAARVASELDGHDALSATLERAEKTETVTRAVVTVDETETRVSAEELVRRLRHENPRVYVGADDVHRRQLSVNPMCLSDEEADYVVERIEANLE